MGNVEVRRKNRIKTDRFIGWICVGALLIAAYFSYFYCNNYQRQADVRELRVRYAAAVAIAEAGNYEKLGEYECAVIDHNAKVIFTNSREYQLGEKINPHSLSTGSSIDGSLTATQFISPILYGNAQSGTLVILIPKTDNIWSLQTQAGLLLPLLLFFVFILVCSIRLRAYIRNNIEAPLVNINKMADDILKGNYDTVIDYDNEYETGKLCRKIELIRDEIKNSNLQAKKFHENEKMLLACISHDLKTPIATIVGCAEGIRDGVAKQPEDLKRYSETILNKSKLLTKLINDILSHSTAELEDFTINRQDIYADEYIKEVLDTLTVDIMGNGLTLETDEVPRVLINIAPDRIYQVFQNIIGNSIKYTPRGGIIHVGFELCSNALAVEISDNGQGISVTDIPFIFDKFYRGEKARTQKNITGSGLGLSIVRNIIERHGGRVECDSVLGQGTTIRFLLPFA